MQKRLLVRAAAGVSAAPKNQDAARCCTMQTNCWKGQPSAASLEPAISADLNPFGVEQPLAQTVVHLTNTRGNTAGATTNKHAFCRAATPAIYSQTLPEKQQHRCCSQRHYCCGSRRSCITVQAHDGTREHHQQRRDECDSQHDGQHLAVIRTIQLQSGGGGVGFRAEGQDRGSGVR